MSSEPQSAAATYWQIALRPMAAYCAASVVAGFIAYPLWIFVTHPQSIASAFFGILAMGFLMSGYIAVFALVPTIVAVTLVRLTPLRRGFADTIAGGTIGTLAITAIDLMGGGEFLFDEGDLFRTALYGLAGLAGGATFWLANGRPTNPRAR